MRKIFKRWLHCHSCTLQFSSALERRRIKLDLGGRKVLQYVGTDVDPPKSSLDWMGEWEE